MSGTGRQLALAPPGLLVTLAELDARKAELELLCDALTSCRVGNDVTAPRPDLSSPQHGFVTTTIWLSSWLVEAWGTSLKYLLAQAGRVGTDAEEAGRFTYALGRLRTFFAHNLDPGSTRDRATRDTCYTWFKDACGSRVPGPTQWEPCLAKLLESALAYLEVAIGIARAVEQHPDSVSMANQWRDRLSRTDVVVDYLEALQRAAGDLGCEGLDLVQIRDRYRKRWSDALSLVPATADLEEVTSRHMEQALLAEIGRRLPFTAADVMERLRLQPGEQVAVALRLGQVIYSLHPNLDRTSLLALLADFWGARSGVATEAQAGGATRRE
ncbi:MULTISPECIES: hypothetical protein [unclassified Streptomyces]|uniref:hypothetical protein n=1 Tax=unclassified Streptomyces TaxID=2593676 RepID=UPI0035DA642E